MVKGDGWYTRSATKAANSPSPGRSDGGTLMGRALPPAVLPLLAASLAFLAAQGFGRFGFGLVLPAMRDDLGLSTGEMGLMAGIGLAAYLVSSVPSGAL